MEIQSIRDRFLEHERENLSVYAFPTSALEGKRDKVLASMNRAVRADTISIEDNLALIAIVGRAMVKAKGTAARVFDALASADINIRMIDQGSSEISIIVGIEEHDFDKALEAIYKEFVK